VIYDQIKLNQLKIHTFEHMIEVSQLTLNLQCKGEIALVFDLYKWDWGEKNE